MPDSCSIAQTELTNTESKNVLSSVIIDQGTQLDDSNDTNNVPSLAVIKNEPKNGVLGAKITESFVSSVMALDSLIATKSIDEGSPRQISYQIKTEKVASSVQPISIIKIAEKISNIEEASIVSRKATSKDTFQHHAKDESPSKHHHRHKRNDKIKKAEKIVSISSKTDNNININKSLHSDSVTPMSDDDSDSSISSSLLSKSSISPEPRSKEKIKSSSSHHKNRNRSRSIDRKKSSSKSHQKHQSKF